RCLPFGGCPRGDLGAFAATALGRQHDQFARNDLGDVARLLLAVFPGAVLDPPLDVDLIALLEVLLGDVRQAGSFVVPADDPVPLRLLLLFTTLRVPLPAGRHRQRGHAGTVVRAAHLGIGPQIPDDHDFVETAAHNDLRRLRGLGAQGCPTVYESQVILSIKDTPLVAKLRITSVCRNGSPQYDGVLDRTPVVTRPASHLLEPE